MLDWTRPIKMVGRPDVDGGVYAPMCYLHAMLDDAGSFVSLSARKFDRDTQRHFAQQFDAGVRFLVTADRDGGKPIYYDANGEPWLAHHARLINTTGASVSLEGRAARAVKELEAQERRRVTDREARAQAIIDAKLAEDHAIAERSRQLDAMENSSLWGTF